MNLYCNNCGKNGHLFHQCKSPIISYGLIVFRENLNKQNEREYLLIKRRDTLGFVDFMRGKYSIYNKEYILNMIKQMTNNEKNRLINNSFSKLWEDLWGGKTETAKLQPSSDSMDTLTLDAHSPESISVPVQSTKHIRQWSEEPPHNIISTPGYVLQNEGMEEWASGRSSTSHFDNPITPTFICKSYPLLQIASITSENPAIIPRTGLGALTLNGNIAPIHHKTPNSPNAAVLHTVSHHKANRNIDHYAAEEQNSRNKFESLKNGVYTKTECYTLEELIHMTEPIWTEPEWGFPKGRRNYQERDYDCAVREFCEETGYNPNKLIPLKNIQPFEEIFTGSNYKSYKHKYYVAYMKYDDTLSSRLLQESEVSESAWMSVDKCDIAVRSYNVEKKRVLWSVDKMLSDNYLSKICS